MASPIAELLLELKSDPRFVFLLEALKQSRPEIPAYPKVSEGEWIHASGQRRGFDIAVSLFHIDLDERGNL